jgi:hypothetical protein
MQRLRIHMVLWPFNLGNKHSIFVFYVIQRFSQFILCNKTTRWMDGKRRPLKTVYLPPQIS